MWKATSYLWRIMNILNRIGLLIAGIVLLFGLPADNSHASDSLKGPMLLVTAEYTPYERLAEPDLVELFSRYEVAICLCVREDQVEDELDHLYEVYEGAGIPILLWPLLPMRHGLYVNKHTTDEFLDYLDVIFGWADEHGHRIEALVVDVEPSYIPPEEGKEPAGLVQNFRRVAKDIDSETFDASIPEFNRIIEKIHQHDCLAVAAAFPFVIDDRMRGIHAWEDLFGGPVATVEWDYLAVMMYTSWFKEYGKIIGLDWDAAHYLAYDYSRDLKEIWRDKAAVAVGVTSPGQGHEKVMYDSPDKIAPALAAVKAAGIDNLGIYDIKGILESGDAESWFKVLTDTQPTVPKKGRRAAKMARKIFKAAGRLLEIFR
jgi:hypothetical protein